MPDMPAIDRRSVLGMIGGMASSLVVSGVAGAQAVRGSTLPPWTPGSLDIHHIATGRGNCALIIMPDGTSAMVDAGDKHSEPLYLCDLKPDASRRPGEWLGRYAKRHLMAAKRSEIDYFIVTHLHDDHLGEIYEGAPNVPGASYSLTGVSDVNNQIPIKCFLDRAFPDYNYPTPQTNPSALNYIAFIRHQQSLGRRVEAFRPGSHDQIRLLKAPRGFPGLQVQNLAANGEVWTGFGEETRKTFPDLASLKLDNYPDENMCSLALRVSYGKFDYYTGGDLSNKDNYGADPWRDIETAVAEVAGPVEVAVVNHHGYADADGPGVVRALRPQAFIIEAWDSAHPTVNTLANLMSKQLYPGDRDIYATAMKYENFVANKQLRTLKSQEGHVVVRVAPGGATYQIVVTSNKDESDQVVNTFGPFACA